MEARKLFKWCYFSQEHTYLIGSQAAFSNFIGPKKQTTDFLTPSPIYPSVPSQEVTLLFTQFPQIKETKHSLFISGFSVSLNPFAPAWSPTYFYCRHHSQNVFQIRAPPPTLTPLHTHGIFQPQPCENFPDVLVASAHAPLSSVFITSQPHPMICKKGRRAAYNWFPSLTEQMQSSCNPMLAGSQTSCTAILSPPPQLCIKSYWTACCSWTGQTGFYVKIIARALPHAYNLFLQIFFFTFSELSNMLPPQKAFLQPSYSNQYSQSQQWNEE